MHSSEPQRLASSVRMRAALALGLLVAPLGVNTMAYWSDTDVIKPGAVPAGTFDLKVNNLNGPIGLGTITPPMNPGESKATIFTLSNDSLGDHAVMLVTIGSTSSDGGTPGTTAALTAKVTADTWTNGSVCGGPPIQTDVSFNRPLLTKPLEVASGVDRKVCIQATASGAAPPGGSATIAVTFAATLKNPN